MKKYLALLAAVLLLGGCGCGSQTGGRCTAERAPEIELPTLTVTAGAASAAASRGTSGWSIRNGEHGTGATFCCGHPLDDESAPWLDVPAGDTAALEFSDPPDEISAVFWPESARDDVAHAESKAAEVTLTALTPQPGRNVYELTASWDRETYSGTVRYVLCLSTPENQTSPASLGSRLEEITP